MQMKSDGAEIDDAVGMQVYGDWIRFRDGEGALVKIPPYVIKNLMMFAYDNAHEFSVDAWVEE
jgi:hypothetical protein